MRKGKETSKNLAQDNKKKYKNLKLMIDEMMIK
jgi:hypothetical protein